MREITKKKQKTPSFYQIFRRSEQASYPQLLIQFMSAQETPLFQIEKAEMLLTIWADEYKKMPQINKSTYYHVMPRFLKYFYSMFVTQGKAKGHGAQAISTLYFLVYKKWNEMTTWIQKGLRESDERALLLCWRIGFNMIRNIEEMERVQFGQFLANHFQQPLSKYKWTCHAQKMYILQTVKYINNQQQYQPFIQNGKKWSQIIKKIKQQNFQSQIPKPKSSDLNIILYRYEYQQQKKLKKPTPSSPTPISASHSSRSFENFSSPKFKSGLSRKQTLSTSRQELRQKTPFEIELQKKMQKQYFTREEINIFLVVKDKQEEKEIYRLEIISEIISNRPLLAQICEELWNGLAYQIIEEFYKKMENLNIQLRTDVLLTKVFLGLLRYRKTLGIIKDKIGEDIVVKIINNIESLGLKSPFENPGMTQIPTLVNKAFFQITTQMTQQGITVQHLLNKRIKSIIDEANAGKDDIISRSLLTVSCRQQLTLQQPIIKQIQQFIMTSKKKKSLSIETIIILTKILISSFKSPMLKSHKYQPVSISLPEICQHFSNPPPKRLTQLRKSIISFLVLAMPTIADDQQNYEKQHVQLMENTLSWLEVYVEKNFNFVYSPMIYVLIFILNRYREFLLARDQCMDYFEKLLYGIMEKLGHEHDSENMYAFLDCIMKAYITLEWSQAYDIYTQIPQESFVGWESIYIKQARILFKREEEKKWRVMIEEEKQKREKDKKWKGILKRKNTMKQQQLEITPGQADRQLQKKCEQRMKIFYGSVQINWLKQLIVDHELWNQEPLIKSQFACLEFSLCQTLFAVQKQYYWKSLRPNQYMKKILADIDADLCSLFNYLMDCQSYQLLFIFASKIFMICRDFFFVSELKSYQLLFKRVFAILSVFFNKVEILYACSAFSSLLIPYANNPAELNKVYAVLNHQEFITDLFKGSNQFIGKEKYYYPWLIKILMAYQLTQEFRVGLPLVKQALNTLGKNALWWGNVEYIINAQIQVFDNQVAQSKILIFDIFKKEYKKIIQTYFAPYQKYIDLKKKQKQVKDKDGFLDTINTTMASTNGIH